MANYSDENYNNSRQRDLVLAANEFCYLQNRTNGVIKTYVGPITMTISAQEALVVFDEKTKYFYETENFDKAKQLLISPPENWYAVLKNPGPDNIHPEAGKATVSPALEVGRKINVSGPCAFALYPGQMAKIIKGHHLRSNQYLLARVYDPVAAQSSVSVMVDAEGNTIENNEKYYSGQMLIIKGTDVSFYIPPTGIEIVAIDNDIRKGYVREAVTLERLEYSILKDENGNKSYKYGPEVVFPKPTETFVTSPSGGYIFRAIELSKISGIYVKVIAEYKDEDGTIHPAGEEMFITGEDQMIYYPRPEHAIINYDNKIMHHAIAIPEGEGRYIMNRMTGEIKTIKGPAMYLPDPRTEVVVKRKLSQKQCDLWFPGNVAAKMYNNELTEKSVEKNLRGEAKGISKTTSLDSFTDVIANNLDTVYSTGGSLATTLANLETNASISRGTSYTKPRTITLDNKYDGVVTIDVWTGYAVNVISKSGERKVICGPQTILLDYDQTLEELQMSTGKPKTTDNLIHTVYLRHENNKISDIINIETKDFVKGEIKVSYCVNFLKDYQNKWFNVENYIKFLTDRVRAEVKRMAKNYTIEEFYANYSELVRECVLTDAGSRRFEENGMSIVDCEVLSMHIDNDIAELMFKHQREMIEQTLKLSDAAKRVEVAEQLAEAEQKEQEVRNQVLLNKLELQEREALQKLAMQAEINRQTELSKLASKQAEADTQLIINAIHDAKIERDRRENEVVIEHKARLAEIEKAKNEAYADMVTKIMASVSPDLIASMTSRANANLVEAISQSVAPYAIANDESVSDVVNKMVRGLPVEDILKPQNND